jgi:hypothetical protein
MVGTCSGTLWYNGSAPSVFQSRPVNFLNAKGNLPPSPGPALGSPGPRRATAAHGASPFRRCPESEGEWPPPRQGSGHYLLLLRARGTMDGGLPLRCVPAPGRGRQDAITIPSPGSRCLRWGPRPESGAQKKPWWSSRSRWVGVEREINRAGCPFECPLPGLGCSVPGHSCTGLQECAEGVMGRRRTTRGAATAMDAPTTRSRRGLIVHCGSAGRTSIAPSSTAPSSTASPLDPL